MTEEKALFEELKGTLLGVFQRGIRAPLEDEEFNDLALRIFRFQLRANPIYGTFVNRHLTHPEKLVRWEGIPPLPTGAFKAAPLVSGDPSSVEAVFRTSGTTQGRRSRGSHRVRSLELYRGSLTPNFQAHLLPEGIALPILALLPSPLDAPESSLSFMVGEMGGEGSGFFWHSVDGLRVEAYLTALREAEAGESPVLLAGTAFSFVRWLEVAGREGWTFRLPSGTRIMETGGFKGRVKAQPREGLYEALSRQFGVSQERIINEYGMTELLSQFYEPLLAADGGMRFELLADRFHRPPPWVRTRALHPLSLEPVGEGEAGILAHFDLANLGSVSAILTEDLGTLVPDGFILHGRAQGAEPRGCSLAMEDFLAGLEGEAHVL